jgi:arylsulfatase A-like enzyme
MKSYFKNFMIFGMLAMVLGCANPGNNEQSPGSKKPNVLIFLTDDNAFEYWGFGGGPKLSPTIDQIAADGVRLTEYYVSSSVCTPSRYTMHTGKYAGRCLDDSFQEEFPDDVPYSVTWNTFLDSDKETTLGELLQKNGYSTGFVGKWHMSGHGGTGYGFKPDDDPADPEVDEKLKAYQQDVIEYIKSTGYDYAASITPYNNDWHKVDAVNVHNLEWYAKGAMDYIEMQKNSDEPFFLIVNITTHHGPCHRESLKADVNLTQAGYVDGLENIMPPRESVFERIKEKGYPVDFKTTGSLWTDDCVNAVLSKLEAAGMENNTAVVFTSDHNRFDGKATCYQGGVHTPYVMKLPGVIPEGDVCNERIQNIDILPTVLGIAGSEVPDDVKIDGENKWPEIKGEKLNTDRELYFEFGYTRSIMVGDYKYIAFRLPDDLLQNVKNGEVDRMYSIQGMIRDEVAAWRYPHFYEAEQLYNLRIDPGEQTNLAYDPQYKDKLNELKERLRAKLATFDNPFPLDNPDPFYFTEKYDRLCEKARDFDMSDHYWYTKQCY